MMMRNRLAKFGFYRPRPGDVVRDRYDRIEKTVERVESGRVFVAFFVGDVLRRGSLLRRSVSFVR